MSKAKECDICHKFYKRYDSKDFDGFVLVGGDCQLCIDLCPDCQKVMTKILYHGCPNWISEELYDPKRFGDWVLVRTRNPETGKLIPSNYYVATKRNGEWIEQNTERKIKIPVAYFACLSQIDDLLGGPELE